MSTMKFEGNKGMRDAVRKITIEAWGEGDLDVVDEVMGPGFVSHTGMEDVEGIEAYKAWIADMHESFSDIRVDLHDVLADGDQIAARYTMTAEHTGEFMGVAPSNRRITMNGTAFARFEDGHCVEEWSFGDMFGMFSQIGSFPESMPGAA